MPIAANSVYEIKTFVKFSNQLGINVHRYLNAVSIPDESEAGLLGAWNSFMADQYAPVLSTLATFEGITLQRMQPDVGPLLYSGRIATVGQVAGDPLPPQTCGLISWRTALAGRRNRGRTYVPFPSEAWNTATGVVQGAAIDDYNALAFNLISPILELGEGPDDVTFQRVISSRDPADNARVTSGSARPFWATQRRRSNFGAENSSPF